MTLPILRQNRPSLTSQARKSGFTLLELVLALGILSIMATVAFAAVRAMIQGATALEDGQEQAIIANALLDRVSREFQLAVAKIPMLPPQGNLTLAPSPNVNLVGEKSSLPNGNRGDSISFLAREGGQFLLYGRTNAGVVQVTYRLEEDPENSLNNMVLIREEVPVIRPAKTAYERKLIFPICPRVQSLSFQYFDEKKDTWHETWGTQTQTGLPSLIRFSVSISSPQGLIKTYTTAVAMRQ